MKKLYLIVNKGVFNVRINPELHKRIYQEALKDGVSLNAFVQNVLKKDIMKHGIN
ncbi:MAG: hypothetical protein COB17_08605 [Sulfurimonas sp.]|nr:MAG: hypothetical protein COB17_08605 [Sulfurimonas sp.]